MNGSCLLRRRAPSPSGRRGRLLVEAPVDRVLRRGSTGRANRVATGWQRRLPCSPVVASCSWLIGSSVASCLALYMYVRVSTGRVPLRCTVRARVHAPALMERPRRTLRRWSTLGPARVPALRPLTNLAVFRTAACLTHDREYGPLPSSDSCIPAAVATPFCSISTEAPEFCLRQKFGRRRSRLDRGHGSRGRVGPRWLILLHQLTHGNIHDSGRQGTHNERH